MAAQSSLKKVLNNSLIILSGNMGANMFGLLSIVIFTHSMGAKVFGYYVLFLTFIEIVDRFFNFQTWQAFIKFATDFQLKNEDHNVMMLLKYCFLIDFYSLSLAFLVAFFSVDYFVSFFSIPSEYINLVTIMTFSILLRIFEISTGVFRIFDEFRIQSKILVYAAILKFITFGVIALVSSTFGNFIYATIFTELITFLMKLHYSKQILNQNNIRLKSIIAEQINYKLIKELKILSFIMYNNFNVAVRMVSRQLDVVILGKLYGAEIVGIYRIAKEVANLIARLTDPIYQAIYPEFATLLAKGEKSKTKQLAKKISFYASIAGIVFYLVFVVIGEYAINIAFGRGFKEAYSVTLVYFIAIYVAIISLPLVPILHSKGFAKEAFSNQLLATVVYVSIVYPITLELSAIGSSIAYIIYYITWLFLTLRTIIINKVFL